ncbi:phthalate 4,5-dioxygenase reductase subunit [Lutimaribacter pacificus]|uniref:Phthalate 4,5-dioxygenase, reductase subunit n=1 Tax=Lutimaribacter pacificus TaxID=391948 RepID=A0A1H0GHV5_9RHOB|nr:PDR/VanB family oxidoreductase [Lutimaribacter pacificus]SDO06507.1 phthalate 4,5-dioxygenase reductase subunit [Lutimaribacter pacificus]SHJ88490.1 phthalate 4,5-dioxygenase, reductase subunit [Lutimaribacter pacificus]
MEQIRMRVAKRRDLTPSISEFTLVPVDQVDLPEFAPGAHVTIETPSGAMRRYSLVNDGTEPKEYVIAIKREPESRGGSSSMHDEAHEGYELTIEPPENDFPLTDVQKYLLIAGGIGVTPIYAMARYLDKKGKALRIIYVSRSAEESAYLAELNEAFDGRIIVHHDNGNPDDVYDFWDDFVTPRATHVFCCGPKPLMEEIKAVSGHWPEGRIHFEDFKPVDVVREDDVAFEVELKKSGETVTVPEDRSILEALRDAGHATSSSCESGTCGTCKTRLLAGDADHRDMVLMDEEKGDFIMICVSRAKSGRLVLDL